MKKFKNETVNEPIEITSEEGLTNALDRLFKILPSLISIVIGFTTFAYVIGWIHAKSYYSGFNASWIVSELSNFEILTFSWLSLSQLIFFIYLGITDLMVNKNRYKTTFFILKYGWYLIILIYVADLLLDFTQLTTLKNIVGGVSLPILFTAFAGASFELLLINLQHKDFKWELMNIYIIYGIVVFGFYFLPMKIGSDESLRDRDINKSNLSKIYLHDDDRTNLRLLKSSGELFYIVILDSNKTIPEIKVVDYKQIKTIK
jgi:hypothetical protein